MFGLSLTNCITVFVHVHVKIKWVNAIIMCLVLLSSQAFQTNGKLPTNELIQIFQVFWSC